MKYIVFERRNESKQLVKKYICDSEESLVATIQNLQIDPKSNREYKKKNDIRVFPYFQEGQMILNLKTLQTRIVYHVSYECGVICVYNYDTPNEVKLQRHENIPLISEIWMIKDCIPVDAKKAREEYNFQFGTEMGVHPQYAQIQAGILESLFD